MANKLIIIFLLLMSGLAQAATPSELSIREIYNCQWPFLTSSTVELRSDFNVHSLKFEFDNDDLNSKYRWTESGNDLRILDEDAKTVLPYWIESWDQSSEKAIVWIYFPESDPFIAGTTRNIHLVYGNDAAPALPGEPYDFFESGIKYHVRNTSYSPSTKEGAFERFDSHSDDGDNTDGYGCALIQDYSNVEKNDLFGSGKNFAVLSQNIINVPAHESGIWEFRLGADYSRGGGIYVDNTLLEERWETDLWWQNDWMNDNVLSGNIFLSAGDHELSIIGFDDCCDQGSSVQYKKPNGNWAPLANDSNLSIKSKICALANTRVNFDDREPCDLVDLKFRSVDIPTHWEIYVDQEMSFKLRNSSDSDLSTSSNPITVKITAPDGFLLKDFSGEGWSNCTMINNITYCQYDLPILRGDNSPIITVSLSPGSPAPPGDLQIAIEVVPYYYDVNLSNNIETKDIEVEDPGTNSSIIPECMSKPGILAMYLNTYDYSPRAINNEEDMATVVSARKNEKYLYGRKILPNINGSGNPFGGGYHLLFLGIFEGYLYAPVTGQYTIAVDGDDAIEVWIDGKIISTYYGIHTDAGRPVDPNEINLEAGYHSLEYRISQDKGASDYDLYWQLPNSENMEIIAPSFYSQCSDTTNINIEFNISVLSDEVNDGTLAKAIPGSIIKYTAVVSNHGEGSTDPGTMVITQAIDSNSELFVGDLSGLGSGPIHFIDGELLNQSGLTYTYNSNGGSNDSLYFSIDGGISYLDSIPSTEDYNGEVTHIQIRFDGTFKSSILPVVPGFQLEYKVKMK